MSDETKTQAGGSAPGFWLFADEKILLGPFRSQELAIQVRVYVEAVRGREDVSIREVKPVVSSGGNDRREGADRG